MTNIRFELDHDDGNCMLDWLREQEDYTNYIRGKLIRKNNIIHRDKLVIKYKSIFSDFVIGYSFRIPWNDGVADININEYLAGVFNLGTGDVKLFNIALQNDCVNYICDTMDEFLLGLGVGPSEPLGKSFRVLTNEDKWYGAFYLCSDWVLDQACWRVCKNQDDMMIIPSSKHELLVFPANGMDVDFIKKMVYTTNREVVKKDALTDHVYLWHHAEHGNKGHLEEL